MILIIVLKKKTIKGKFIELILKLRLVVLGDLCDPNLIIPISVLHRLCEPFMALVSADGYRHRQQIQWVTSSPNSNAEIEATELTSFCTILLLHFFALSPMIHVISFTFTLPNGRH